MNVYYTTDRMVINNFSVVFTYNVDVLRVKKCPDTMRNLL